MAVAKKRVSGAWVDSTKAGFYRASGAWVAFGPSGGTSETITWPQEPTSTNLSDGTQTYNMGIAFTLVAGKNVLGVRWRVPDAILAPQGPDGHVASIWNASTSTRVAVKAGFTPVPGGYQNILFDTPVALTAGVTYVAAIYTRSYVFRSSTSSVTSTSGNLTVSGGRLVPYNGGGNIYPDGTSNAWFYVAPIVSV
jgi:hypothetical protein